MKMCVDFEQNNARSFYDWLILLFGLLPFFFPFFVTVFQTSVFSDVRKHWSLWC